MRALVAFLALCLSLVAQANGIYVDDSGTVRKVQKIFVDDSGTVREIQRIYVDDSGTIRLVFQNAVVSVSDTNVTRTVTTPSTATASYALENDGDIAVNSVDSSDWITPKSAAGADYECRATVVSGTFTSGTFNTWMALSSTRTWTLVRNSLGTSTASMTIEIRRASDGSVLDSATISFTAEVGS